MPEFAITPFDLGEALRAVWAHQDGTRCHGLYPGRLPEGFWFTCVQTNQPVHLLQIRPMIEDKERP